MSGAPAMHAGLPAAHGSEADDTASLTRAAARGDEQAFAAIYERWFDRALAATHRLTGRDESFCLDVVQDAMLRAARKIPPLPSEAALAAWMCRVVHRAALDRLRADRRRLARERTSAAPSRASTAVLDEEIDWLRSRLRQLSADDRSLLAARFARGRTFEQIATATGLSRDAAHGRIRRALQRLTRQPPQERPQDRTP